MKLTFRREPLNAQQKTVLQLREEQGLTFRAIAAQLGLSAPRVRAVHSEALRRLSFYEKCGRDPLSLLPWALGCFFQGIGLTDRTKLKAAIRNRKLVRKGTGLRYGNDHLRSCGWNTWAALHEWLDLPAPGGRPFLVCPHCGGRIEL